MGTWIIPADLLAESRFVVSPLHETVAALTVLSRPDANGTPWQRSFRAAYLEAYRDLLASAPMLKALDATMWRPRRGDKPGWMADFLTPPPLGDGATFEDELAQLLAWEEPRMRAELREIAGDLPVAAERPGIRGAVIELLRWIWTATVQADLAASTAGAGGRHRVPRQSARQRGLGWRLRHARHEAEEVAR